MKKTTLLLTLCLVYLCSCSIEKRIYRPGFSISSNHSKIRSWNSSKKNDDLSKFENYSQEITIEQPKSELNIPVENLDSPTEEFKSSNNDGIVNSESEKSNFIVGEYKNDAKQINLEPLECDVIVCKNGDEIEAKILEIGIREIKY